MGSGGRGKQVFLNHDYGQNGKFSATSGKDSGKGAGSSDVTGAVTSVKPGAPGKSTLTQGAAGLWEHAARDKAEAEGGADPQKDTKDEDSEEEGGFYRPPLLKPEGHPSKEWAKAVMKQELEGFARDSDFAFNIRMSGQRITFPINYDRVKNFIIMLSRYNLSQAR